jgi:hypothetical protein
MRGRPAARRCGYLKAKGSWRVFPGSATTCDEAPPAPAAAFGLASRRQQPCTSHVTLVHLSCTPDVPASVAVVLMERGAGSVGALGCSTSPGSGIAVLDGDWTAFGVNPCFMAMADQRCAEEGMSGSRG